MVAGSVLDGQVEAWLPWFLSDGHVEVCWPQRSPGTEAGQCVDALPPLTLLLQSPLLGHNGMVARQLPPRRSTGEINN